MRRNKVGCRAFSLLELFVALACGAVILTATVSVITVLRNTTMASATRAQLDRDLRVVVGLMDRDISFFGAGIPSGNCIDEGCTGIDLLPLMRRATSSSLVFLGDQPYPNAELNGTMNVVFGGQVTPPTADDHAVVTSEVSGGCIPPLTGAAARFQCSTRQKTFVPGVYAASDDCDESSTDARTCPWGMGKLQGDVFRDHVLLATSQNAGDWYRRMWDGDTENTSPPYLSMHFVHNGGGAIPIPNLVNYAFLSQPDRVFYSFENNAGGACAAPPCRLMRNQCWGDISAPNAGGFPLEGTTAIRSTTSMASCDPTASDPEGTGWEEVASNVESFSLTYFQNPTTPIASPVATGSLAAVRLVQLDIRLKRTGGGQTIERGVRQLYFLKNREREAP